MDSTYEMVKELIDFNCKGVDTYNHNGSTWLIFTDNKKWVIELTKEKTLWYNYYFFTGVFKYLSLDVVENQHYITKWVEDTIINSVKSTKGEYYKEIQKVEYTIQNGVKKTYSDKIPHEYDWTDQFKEEIGDIIQNGVKHTEKSLQIDGSCVIEDVIREGVKHTEYGDWLDGDERLDDIIDNGIKETHDDAYHHTGRVDGVIKNGVKQCIPSHTPLYNPMDFSVQYRENHRLDDVASVLEKGIKKTKVMDEWVNTDRIVDGVISKGVKKSPI